MSKILKKFCGIFGYKLLAKNYIKNKNYLLNFSCLKLESIILNLAEKKIINSLIQIGANDGVSHDHLHKIIKKFRLQSLLLEPIKKYFLDLQNNYAAYDNVKLENSALSINNEIFFLYKVNPEHFDKYGTLSSGISSFNKEHLLKHGIKKKHIVQEKVNQISFDELLNKYNFKSFDLLLIDTEGYDCNIVNNFFLKIKEIRPIIIFEWSHIKNNELENTLSNIIKNSYSFFPIGDDIFCYPTEKNIVLQLN
jgi:FkbM family methyltransferase